jgi:hypothetical protein
MVGSIFRKLSTDTVETVLKSQASASIDPGHQLPPQQEGIVALKILWAKVKDTIRT